LVAIVPVLGVALCVALTPSQALALRRIMIIGDSIQSGRTCTGHRIKQVFASSEKATSSSTTSRVPALG